ncbi:hypothetical protein Goshw_005820, partial [Gossypium schwendimanii]|nr:hypothetical protein [Gossypium schwendimanii]
IEEQLQVIPSELEIIKQYFEKRSSELKKDRTVGRGKGAVRQYRSRNSAIELKVSLNKIEELKRKIEELETALQNCELQVELIKINNEH